jgi:hypothetical protein
VYKAEPNRYFYVRKKNEVFYTKGLDTTSVKLRLGKKNQCNPNCYHVSLTARHKVDFSRFEV